MNNGFCRTPAFGNIVFDLFFSWGLMSELWFKCQNCGSNVRIVVQMSGLWFKCQDCGSNVGIVVRVFLAISGWMGWVGLDGNLCAGLFYEHRFAMLKIKEIPKCWCRSYLQTNIKYI